MWTMAEISLVLSYYVSKFDTLFATIGGGGVMVGVGVGWGDLCYETYADKAISPLNTFKIACDLRF